MPNTPSHTMELPRLIVVGEKNIIQIGKFLKSLDSPSRASIIAGKHVQKIVQKKIKKSLANSKIHNFWHVPEGNDEKSIITIQKKVRADRSDIIVGVGGGRSVDVAKMIAFSLHKPFVSVPTAASHDGIASPFVSVRGEKPHSIVATAPLGVFVDIDIIKKAPRRLFASGCGDLVAKITAVRDWELGRDRTGEYYGRYSANLASMSAKILVEAVEKHKVPDTRDVVEALISAGVASCIAGSSRPCSGSEHLFSHALDKIAPNVGLHGEKCGIGAILMAKLQGQDWKKIVATLKNVNAPTTAKQIGLKKEHLAQALVIAQSLRPQRYTILKEVVMTEKKALDLARVTGVI
ncbi:MAG: sn-glycerol-1-phosphate dehydrogenase [Candidatus Nitrosotenuis sp.]